MSQCRNGLFLSLSRAPVDSFSLPAVAVAVADDDKIHFQSGRTISYVIADPRRHGRSSTRTFPQRILHIRAVSCVLHPAVLTCRLVITSHQKVVLEIDFSGRFWGYTEISIIPTAPDLKTIFLNSRHCAVQSVSVAGKDADFTYVDPISTITIGSTADDAKNSHHHPELKRKLYAAFQEGDDGELAIAIPKDVSLKPQPASAAFGAFFQATPEPQIPNPANSQEFSTLVVTVTYTVKNPTDGVEFILPDAQHPYRVPHAYTTPSSPDAARFWVPCFDSVNEKCTWEFEFVVPRYLEEVDIMLDEEANDLSPTLVICSGELVEQVAHPYNSHKTIFTFSQTSLTSVQHIAWAAGPFHLLSIPTDNLADDTSVSSQPPIYAFCLPGHEAWLVSSTTALRPAMNFFTAEYGSYPFTSYKVVFVDELPVQRFDSSTLSLMTVDLLHGDDALESAMESRQTLSHALACQWAGINIQPKSYADTWLVNGLALYITGLFLKKLFGNNEYRFRLKKDMQRVLERDNGAMPPICQPQIYEPPDPNTLPFINLKAPLVLHMLDRRLGKSGTSLGLSRVLPKVFLSVLTGEMVNNVLSTHAFLRTCRKVSGVDLRTFAEQWIYGSGCPAFGVSATFNRKKMAVEITMRQESPAWKAHEGNEVTKLLLKPVAFFEGTMTIRIHEADGTPYEHVLDIRSPFKRYEVPFNTKYKRVRRNTKRYLARQAAAQAAAEGDTEAAEAMGMVDMGFGLEIWEKEKERENWKVADWTEEEESAMSGATYEWIRMDADFEWMANLNFEQPDFMWVSQLQRDRDVVAQLEAVNALSKQPTAIVSSTLTKTVLVSNYHYRIRCEAASALVQCAIRKLDFLGLFHLFKLFLRYCYEPEDSNQDLFSHTYVPKPNDFSDISEYFVRKTLIEAISKIRFENGKSPSVVRQFLIDQLKYNDNTANPYSDGLYICAIITAAACATVSKAAPERGELLPSEVRSEHNEEDQKLLKDICGEVERYISMDRLIPSTHNIVSIACLEFYLIMGVANLLPNVQNTFFTTARYGNYTPVRIAAFDGLFMTKWYSPAIMRYVLAVIANDPSRAVRRHVARNACHSLALLVQMGDIKASSKENDLLLIEEDGSVPEKSKESKKNELDAMIRALRKEREVGKNEVLREFIMAIATAPDVDYEVRWAILKLADMLIRPVNEEPPKFSLHLPPSTPISETPPVLPRVTFKPPRKPSTASLPAKSPVTPATLPVKLRLSNGASTREISPRSSPAPPPIRLHTPRLSTPVPPPRKEREFAVPAPPIKIKSKNPNRPSKHSGPSISTSVSVPSRASRHEQPAKGQGAGGMTTVDLKVTRNALNKVKTNKHARWFLAPVDPVRDSAPNYFDVIKDPIDLSTIGARLNAGMYADRFAFQAAFRLMIANAKLYNSPGSVVHNAAISLELSFDKQWSVITKTLEASTSKYQAAAAAAPPPPTPPIRILPPVPTPKFSPPPTPSMPNAPRPTIKLKFGSGSNVSMAKDSLKPRDPPKPRGVPKPREIPKPRDVAKAKDIPKPRPVKIAVPEPAELDPPPPPYVDDGSADLLEEVLAIEAERETSEKHRSVQERPTTNGNSQKRKKDMVSDDVLLDLASPAKREKHSSSTPVASSSRILKASHAPKARREKEEKVTREVKEPASRPSSVPLRPSLKGKEKEVRPATPSKPAPVVRTRKPPNTNTPINAKKCRDFIKVLQKVPDSIIFMQPVDPDRDGCPEYFSEILNPMDFGTMLEKLDRGEYTTMEAFKDDFDLVMDNCLQFNPPPTLPHVTALSVLAAAEKEWPKALRMAYPEKRSMQGILSTLLKDPVSFIFREAVDPVLLGIPTYFDVIPKKDARDLGLIKTKLDADKYETVEALDVDMNLMVDNAITFNGVESEVGQLAVTMRRRWRDALDAWRNGLSKKRKDGDKGSSQPNKKAKLS